MALSSGKLQEIITCADVADLPAQPVMQILGVKKMANANGDRYRLVLSDGIHYYTSVMLATQINDIVHEDGIDQKCIIRLDRYTCNTIQAARKIIVLLEVTIVEKSANVRGKIGEPEQISDQISNQPTRPASNGQNVQQQQNSMPARNTSNNNPIPQRSSFGNKPTGNASGGGASAGSVDAKGRTVFPISSLTPYQNRWTIRARVTNKSSIRTWSNSKGEGKLFNVDLLDESGEIRATGFNESVDKYYEMLETGKVYYFTKGSLKTANKQYSTLRNDYEMSINNDTLIEPCLEDVELPQIQYNFVSISDLEKVNKDALVDLIGVVKSPGDITQITTKQTNKQVSKRDLTIVDRSGHAVNATLWGGEAEKFEQYASQNPIVAIKGAKVSDFGGRSLSILNSSVFHVNPDIPECHTLRGWYENAGKDAAVKTISGQVGGGGGVFKTIGQIKEEHLGEGEKPDYFNIRATVVFFRKENAMYTACPSDECNKKVNEENGTYRCEKCDKSYPNFNYRLMLSLNASDFSGNQWLTAFQESAEAILGVTAEQLGRYKETDESNYDRVFTEATFKTCIIKVRAKHETYQDESRLKCSAVSATPIDFKSESRRMYDEILRLEAL